MNDEQRAAYIAMVGAAQEALHERQLEALAAYPKPEQRLQLQTALLDASRAYKRQIGLR